MGYELKVGDSGYYDVYENGSRLGIVAVPGGQADEEFIAEMEAAGWKTFQRSDVENLDECDADIVTSSVFAIDPSEPDAYSDGLEDEEA